MHIYFLFWVSIVAFCIDCTLARPSGEAPPGKVPPGQKNDQEKNGADPVSEFLKTLGYKNRPKTAGDWREAFVAAAYKYFQLRTIAMRVGVTMYTSMRFEIYEGLWNTGGDPGADFIHDYIPKYLPDNSQKEYKSHHKIWKIILDSSTHPGVVRFRDHLKKKFGIKKNDKVVLDTEMISRNIAFAIVMLQNSKHGKEAKEVGMDLLQSPSAVREALIMTNCISDPDVLNIVEMFEEVTRGMENISQ